MPRWLEPSAVQALVGTVPLLDVRSPGEFASGHVPGAVNLPLFNDEERAAVGTCYARESAQAAVRLGLGFVGPKLGDFVDRARALVEATHALSLVAAAPAEANATSPGSDILVHCWRGGMRSSSMAWLLETAGLRCGVMVGGYRAWRTMARSSFGGDRPLRVVGGLSGSGKTAMLRALARRGAAVLDLEALARHRGSAFGDLPQVRQPTQEQFENDVAAVLLAGADELWVEDESFNLGRVRLPPELLARIGASPLWLIETDPEHRVRRLVAEYAGTPPDALATALGRIRKRLGTERHDQARAALRDGNMAEVVRLCLRYYDKAYGKALAERTGPRLRDLPPEARAAWDEVVRQNGGPEGP